MSTRSQKKSSLLPMLTNSDAFNTFEPTSHATNSDAFNTFESAPDTANSDAFDTLEPTPNAANADAFDTFDTAIPDVASSFHSTAASTNVTISEAAIALQTQASQVKYVNQCGMPCQMPRKEQAGPEKIQSQKTTNETTTIKKRSMD